MDAANPDGATPSPVRFVDVTQSAGLTHVQAPATTNPRCGFWIIQGCGPEMTGGAAAGDVDGDGRVDLFVTRLGAAGILYRNQGDGRFVDATAAAGLAGAKDANGAALADLDNDGDLDLYVSTMRVGRAYLFINNGLGVFDDQAAARGADLATPHATQLFSVSFGDFDRDGWLDLHVSEWRPDEDLAARPAMARLLRNRGAAAPGHFQDVTLAAGVDLSEPKGVFAFASSLVDFDQDGFQDLAVLVDFGESRLFWNNQDGTFTDGTVAAGIGTEQNGMGQAIADYDGDGNLDWFVTSIDCSDDVCQGGTDGNRLFRYAGQRRFEDITDRAGVRAGRWGWGAGAFDHDNDGDVDLVMTNGINYPDPLSQGSPPRPGWQIFATDPMRFWNNDGRGVMSEESALVGLDDTGDGRGLLTLDFDGDGDLDVFVARHGQTPRLYRNDGGNRNAWLKVRPEGVTTNRQGIGARVSLSVTAGAAPQVVEIMGGSNFLGQNELKAHFGLGPGVTTVARLEVIFPGGATRTLTDVAANQTLVVKEN